MATILGVWNGGHGNYAPGDPVGDLERFDSITAARRALEGRYENASMSAFQFVNAAPGHFWTPVVGEDCSIWVYLGEPHVDDDGTATVGEYPDLIITLNERGRAVVEPA